MHNYQKYVLLTGLALGCTVNNVDKGETGGAANVGNPGTGGSVGATGGSSATGGITSSAGSTAVGGSTETGGTTAGGTSSVGLATVVLDSNNGDCEIESTTSWTKAVYDTSDCLIVTVLQNGSVTISAGAIIKFAPGGYLDVDPGGTLTASGTASDPVIFTSIKDDTHGGDTNADGATSPSTDDWGSLGTHGDLNVRGNSSHLDHVQLLYGHNGVWVDAASVTVTNSTFAHNGAYGLVTTSTSNLSKSTTLTGNTFFDNAGFPLSLGTFISVDASNVFHDPANAATKNGKQCIEIGATLLDTAVSFGVTELAYYGSFEVASTLTLANNVCIKVSDSGNINLDANGSIANNANAIFTSYRDDAVGGDCLGDGATTPVAGDWDGIWVATSTDAEYATAAANIRYAGNAGTLPLH